jgi:hypothetical protein
VTSCQKVTVVAGLVAVAVGALIVLGAVQGAQQRDLMERSFATLGRFPDAVAVTTRHEERRITESYVTPQAAGGIHVYYDRQFQAMGWQGPSPEWTEGEFVMRCYGDPTSTLAAKLVTRTVPSASSFAYAIEITRNPSSCSPLRR